MAEPEPLIDNDSPIRTPAEDLFGVDRFAAMVARGLAAQRDANGTVIALHGPWGSGKSSAVNLALHHLAETVDGEIEVIAFNPWWFAGSSALANAFFQTIGSALNRTLREHGSAALGDFFARLKSFNTYADAAARFASDGVTQAVACRQAGPIGCARPRGDRVLSNLVGQALQPPVESCGSQDPHHVTLISVAEERSSG